MASNVDILTKSHTVLKAKARAKKGQIESVVFDDESTSRISCTLVVPPYV